MSGTPGRLDRVKRQVLVWLGREPRIGTRLDDHRFGRISVAGTRQALDGPGRTRRRVFHVTRSGHEVSLLHESVWRRRPDGSG